jgi:hypothetical protein
MKIFKHSPSLNHQATLAKPPATPTLTDASRGPLATTLADRDLREIIREEPLRRRQILELLAAGPLTVPELAVALGRPSHEAMYWLMGLRRYGWVREGKEVSAEGYFHYGLRDTEVQV